MHGPYFNRGNAYNILGNYKQRLMIMTGGSKSARAMQGLRQKGASLFAAEYNISGCRDARKACELGNCELLEMAIGWGNCR